MKPSAWDMSGDSPPTRLLWTRPFGPGERRLPARVDTRGVLVEHARRTEARRVRRDRRLHALAPAMRNAVVAALVELRDDAELEPLVEIAGVARIHHRRIGILVAGNRPPVRAVVGLGPPAVEDAELEHPVEARLHPARAARLHRPARQVDPDVAAAHEVRRDRA